MSDDDFKKKAFSFGKLVWEIGKDVTKAAVDAGKTVAHEIDKTAKDLEKKAQEDRLLETRKGTLECYLPYDVLFQAVNQELSKGMGRRGWTITSDQRAGRLTAKMGWTEYVTPEIMNAQREVHLDLTFRDGGRFILMDYEFFVRETPIGGTSVTQVVRETNRALRLIAEQRMNTSMGDNNPD